MGEKGRMPRLCRLQERVSSTLHLPHPSWLRQVGHRTSLRTQFETSKPKENSIYVVFIVLTNKIGGYLCRRHETAVTHKRSRSCPGHYRQRRDYHIDEEKLHLYTLVAINKEQEQFVATTQGSYYRTVATLEA